MVKKAHVLAVPFPAQGHVTPLLKLSRLIASHGIKVTFVNTHFIHDKIVRASHDRHLGGAVDNLVLASISDGLVGDDRHDAPALVKSLMNTMGGNLTELIKEINASNCDEKISCIVADFSLGWILEIAQDFGVQSVAFLPASVATFALTLHTPTLFQQGILDSNGTLSGSEVVSLSDDIPPWNESDLSWSFPIDEKIQKMIFESTLSIEKSAKFVSKWFLCNSFYELESSACDLNSKFLPVGPLLNTSTHSEYSSSFHSEDSSCLSWLDGKPAASVVYVSFGSVAVWSQRQLDELALGLELSGRAFLWVVRSDLAGRGSRAKYPSGFLDRVCGGGIGKIVEWTPQEKVLSHPSIGCFLSHCGWNSILEGLGTGVPFLCWPYFADQHHNQSYICDKWKIGLKIESDRDGIRGRDEIKKKIEMLFGDDGDDLRANALSFKEMAARSVAQEGSSSMNFQRFMNYLME